MDLPITSISAGLLGLLLVVMGWQVVKARQKSGVALGDGGDALLQRRMRGQSNLIEYAPMGLILIGLGEIQAAQFWILAILSIAFVAARLGHGIAFAFTDGVPFLRFWGTAVTFTSLVLLALLNLALPIF